jgi:hypothetical protein
MDKPETCILTPANACAAGATLRGFVVVVRKVDGGAWAARVTGQLLLPDGTGKHTPEFPRAGRTAASATSAAIEACQRAYAAVEMQAPTPLAG